MSNPRTCRLLRATLCLLLLVLAFPIRADEGGNASERSREFVFQVRSGGRIGDLVWFEEGIRPVEIREQGRVSLFAAIPGRSASLAGGNFVYSANGAPRVAHVDEATGNFRILVPLGEERIVLHIKAIDSYGKVVDEKTTLEVKSQEHLERFFADFGLSASLLDYSEDQAGSEVAVQELGLTAKANAGYRIDPRWDLSGNVFATAIPFLMNASPETLEASRWYGVNGRAGYAFYRRGLYTSATAAFGWYFWGMLSPVEGPVYGVSRLSGPQAFLIFRSKTPGNHSYFAYAKLAAIQGDAGYRAMNRELAVGGGFQPWLRSPVSRRWMLTFDLAVTRYERFKLVSVSTGISRRLW